MNILFLDKLTALILPIGFLLALIMHFLHEPFFIKPKLFLKFYFYSWFLLTVCETLAIYRFDISQIVYYQHEFAFILSEFLKLFGFAVTPYITKCFSYWCDMAYNSATYLLWTYGVVYWIYCLYYKNSRELVRTLIVTGLVCYSLIAVYAVIEIIYFEGSEWAKNILIICNPYLHRVGDGYGWWPPLLWGSEIQRMRSIFAEPSYMGIYFAFLMPLLWPHVCGCEKSKKLFVGIGVMTFAFLMMFLTRSRTAYGITLVQLAIFIGVICFKKHKEYYRCLKILISTCLVAAIFANFITGINISGIDNLENGSNNSRLGYIVATTSIGMKYPVFGAGSELFNFYVEDNSPSFTQNNKEYQTWVNYFNLGGIRNSYPQICEYSTLFAKNGVFGLAIFFLPLLYIIYKLLCRIMICEQDPWSFIKYVLVLISLLGMAATGFSNNINISYCYWVILGVAYVCVHDDGISEINASEQL